MERSSGFPSLFFDGFEILVQMQKVKEEQSVLEGALPEGAVNLDLIVYGELGNVLCIRE